MTPQKIVEPNRNMLDDFETVELGKVGDFNRAKERAWEIATQKRKGPMMMAWWDGDSKQGSPNISATTEEEPAWLKYAKNYGSDLAVDVDHEKYIFLFREGEEDY
jgi:hypothetical protein